MNFTKAFKVCKNFLIRNVDARMLSVLCVVQLLTILVSFEAMANSPPLNLRVIQSGHSLTDHIIYPLHLMVRASGGKGDTIAKSTIPGSPMDVRWNDPPGYDQPDARHDIVDYDMLVLTERVSVNVTIEWHNSLEQALTWFNHAWTEGNDGDGAETILYATWVGIDSGPAAANPHLDPQGLVPFRERMDLEMDGWQSILDHVNANRVAGSPPMRMIPGPLLMAELYDAIERGEVPSISDISDVFSDDIHLNELGAYYIALAHYTVIFDRDPRGLPNRLGLPTSPSRELATWMQDTVWRVVSSYEGSGFDG